LRNYRQLTQEQRYQIHALMKAGFNQTEIASELGVHKATVSREMRRGRGGRGYRPQQAHELAVARRRLRVAPRIQPETWQQVEILLRQQWSPTQISGRLKLEH
jgi:IS30 family transposase